MSKIIVGVRDSAVLAFGQPVFFPSVGAAVRSFSDEVKREAPDNQLNAHPDDFEMWYLGDFDEQSGDFAFVTFPAKQVIARGKDHVKA